jgi:integrase
VKEVDFDATSIQSHWDLQPSDQQLDLPTLNRKGVTMGAMYGGMRFTQIAAMRWETSTRAADYWETDAKRKNNMIERKRLHAQRNEKLDPTSVFDELHRRAAKRQKRLLALGPVFCNEKGDRLSLAQVRAAARDELQAAGIGGRRANLIRSAMITALHDAKAPDPDIARFVGHSHKSQVQHSSYQHNDRGKKCAEILTERYLEKKKQQEKKGKK